jgi:hypothetical protein
MTDKMTMFDKLQLHLFDDDTKLLDDGVFNSKELEIKRRYATVFSFWLDKPLLSEKKIIHFMISELGVRKSQAYQDLHKIKLLLGNVRNANKEWQRFKVIAILDKAVEIAEKERDSKSLILAADKLGKYTQLDKEDVQKIPYHEIVPQSFEPTDDVTVLGIEPIKDLKERQKKMREKYGGAVVEDTSFEMVETDGETNE